MLESFILGTAQGMREFDIQILYFLNGFAGKSIFFDDAVLFLLQYLPVLLVIVFLLFLYFSSYTLREKFYIFFVTTASSLIARFGVVEPIRFFYHRPRPFLTHELHTLFLNNGWSFPSGHGAFFFALATAVYLYNKKWGIGFFIAALLVSIGRVIAGVHYPSDILGGLIVGFGVGYATFYIARKWA